MYKVVLILTVLHLSQTNFIALPHNSSTPVTFGESVRIYQNLTEPGAALYNEHHVTAHYIDKPRRYHGLVSDDDGDYLTQDSITVIPCQLTELTETQYFYQPLPKLFDVGDTMIVPCLIVGVPGVKVQFERCQDPACVDSAVMTNITQTKGGHLLIHNAQTYHTDYYRCIGTNTCGSKTSSILHIAVAKPDPTVLRKSRTSLILTRRLPTNGKMNTTVDKRTIGVTDKEVKIVNTEYQRWYYYGDGKTFNGEVLFLDPDEVRFRAFGTKKYYYTKKAMPNFVQFQINSSSIIDISWYTGEINTGVNINMMIQLLDPPLIKTTTNMYNPVQVFSGEVEQIVFPVVVAQQHNQYIKLENIHCFRNGVELHNDWQLNIALNKADPSDDFSYNTSPNSRSIVVTVACPMSLHQGYYQCALKYDFLHIGPKTQILVEPSQCARSLSTSANITSTSALLAWTEPPHYNTSYYLYSKPNLFYYNYTQLSVNDTQTILEPLYPGLEYVWYVSAPNGTHVTDISTFSTLSTHPSTTVTDLNIIKGLDYIAFSWTQVSRLAWNGKKMFYSTELTRVREFNSTQPNYELNLSSERVEILTTNPRVNFTSLEQNTFYKLNITVCNNIGCSTRSVIKTIKTEIEPLNRAPNLTVIDQSYMFIKLRVSTEPSVIENRYRYCKKGTCQCDYDNSANTSDSTAVSSAQNVIEIKNLKMYTVYLIQVKSWNGYFYSPWSPCLYIRTGFNYIHLIIPAATVISLILITIVIRIILRKYRPTLVQDIKHALHKKHKYFYDQIFEGERERWQENNDIQIIHVDVD